MTTRSLIPNPPISTAIQRTGSNDVEVLQFIQDRGITAPQFFPNGGEPDMIGNGDEPIWFTLVVHVDQWVVATPAGGGVFTFQSMDTVELEQRYNDLYTG
ncbi:hypothetical protein AB0O87_06205 [Microbacterium sp. NPDC076768]|uniref:hypothetical protein n=1 Tax=Microbacterium sp. NPDC076768 TaxID=3154858 RepID=UPI00343EFDB6